MIIKTSGYIIVVIVKRIIIYSTVNHVTARKNKNYANKALTKMIHKNRKQKWTKNSPGHLHLITVKFGRSPLLRVLHDNGIPNRV